MLCGCSPLTKSRWQKSGTNRLIKSDKGFKLSEVIQYAVSFSAGNVQNIGKLDSFQITSV